ncbi:MAG: 50S ribosomal protein L31e [Rhabdochlamydiaceae bacterium]
MSSKQAATEELERVYTVPLSRAWITPRHRRTKRAVNILREFAAKHMKSSEIKIDTELNEELWKRGITKPPRRITVKMERDEDGLVTISLPKEVTTKKEEAADASGEDKEQTVKAEDQVASSTQGEKAATPEPSITTEKKKLPKKNVARKKKRKAN